VNPARVNHNLSTFLFQLHADIPADPLNDTDIVYARDALQRYDIIRQTSGGKQGKGAVLRSRYMYLSV
jgi:hypothetical protein